MGLASARLGTLPILGANDLQPVLQEFGLLEDRKIVTEQVCGEAAIAAGIGRTLIFEEIRNNRLVARKIGRRTVILKTDLDAWLESRPVARVGTPAAATRDNTDVVSKTGRS